MRSKHKAKTTFLTIVLLSILSLSVEAQEKWFFNSFMMGGVYALDDEAIGIHIGINPRIKAGEFIHIEGQLSYSHTYDEQYEINPQKSVYNSLSALAGFRLYFTPENVNGRIYINGLTGRYLYWAKPEGRSLDRFFDSGFSFGLFIEFNRIVLGICGEPPTNAVLKGGFVF